MPKTNTSKFVYDTYEAPAMIESFQEDADGNLLGRAAVTCVGVFPYMLEDGSIFNELRLPEEVFAKEALDSLRMIPITNNHPRELLTPDNTSKYQVGMTGEDVCRADFWGDGGYLYKTDGTQVTIPIKITDREAIQQIKAGKRGLSCGYTRELEITEGVWGGIHYDGIQRNIRMNHVAICDQGRAGDSAVIRMDSADDENKTFVPTYVEKADSSAEPKTDKKEDVKEGNNMPKTLTLDSATYEVDEKVVEAYDAACKSRDTLQGQLDAANAKIDSLKAEMSGMIKADELGAKVRELQAVKDTANKFGVSLAEDATIMDMKRAILAVAVPALADSLDEKSDEYVNGAFSSIEGMNPNSDSKKKEEEDEDSDSDEKDACGKKKKDEADDSTDSSMFDSVNERLQKKFYRG